MTVQLVLASQSPRRAEILRSLGVSFEQAPADVDETPIQSESPLEYVARLARSKAEKGAEQHRLAQAGLPVLGSDTTVSVDGMIFEKPLDEQDFVRMLSALSGRKHQVFTAVAVLNQSVLQVETVCTQVRFRQITEAEMQCYWRSGEPQGKAGGYAIQGLGGQFVQHIDGSYSAVMGLPLYETAEMLRTAGIKLKGVDY